MKKIAAAWLMVVMLPILSENARTEREVAYYADLLCITPKFELVSLLNDTTKALTEVSDLMNFENASHRHL